MKRPSDFRSDTVTRPTAGMRRAMLEAAQDGTTDARFAARVPGRGTGEHELEARVQRWAVLGLALAQELLEDLPAALPHRAQAVAAEIAAGRRKSFY